MPEEADMFAYTARKAWLPPLRTRHLAALSTGSCFVALVDSSDVSSTRVAFALSSCFQLSCRLQSIFSNTFPAMSKAYLLSLVVYRVRDHGLIVSKDERKRIDQRGPELV